MDDVISNIKTYSNVVNKVYVLDNSKYADADVLDKLKKIDNVEYTCFGENLGVAYALNVALNKAIEDGADYLLTMDQDTSFRDGDAERMLCFVSSYNNDQVALFAANTEEYNGNKEVEFIKLALTSGNLIHCGVIKAIGGFDEDLFIDWIDHDICYRIVANKFKIARLNKVKIKHSLGIKESTSILGKKITYCSHSDIRYYYMARNKFYVLSKNRINWRQRIRFVMGTIFMMMKIIFVEKRKQRKIFYVLIGIKDFFAGKLGGYN